MLVDLKDSKSIPKVADEVLLGSMQLLIVEIKAAFLATRSIVQNSVSLDLRSVLHVLDTTVVHSEAPFRLLDSDVVFFLDDTTLLTESVDSQQLLDVVHVL